MRVLFLIATCERPDMLANLISQITALCPLPSKICVLNDASEKDYSEVEAMLDEYNGWYLRFNMRRGRKRYWQVVDRLFKQAREEEFDYVFKLDDDIELHPEGIEKAICYFDLLSDYRRKNVLNLWVDHRAEERIWTGITPKRVRKGGQEFRQVGWIDGGNWMTSPYVLQALGWECPEPLASWWERPGSDSSGVGKYLSIALSKAACRIYMPMNSLIFHGTHNSVMHSHKDPETRPITMDEKPWL